MKLGMRRMCKASVIRAVLVFLTMACGAATARAEVLNCILSRGNLCFSTGCDNSGKSQRLALDLQAGTFRLCADRYSDKGCSDAAMEFDIRDSAIVGISKAGPEIAARAVFVNRVTGALSTSLLAAGMAGVDFGSCEIPR